METDDATRLLEIAHEIEILWPVMSRDLVEIVARQESPLVVRVQYPNCKPEI